MSYLADYDLNIGDEIECQVARVNEENIYLSRLSQLSKLAFQKVVEAKEKEQVIEVVVTKAVPNKGYNVSFEGNSLFMPLSQSPAEVQIKQKLEVRVIEVNEARKNAIVSRRVIERENYAKAKQEEFDAIEVGQTLKGTIAKVEKFGLFIRFAYNQGLLRINQYDHTFTNDITAVAKVGDQIEVKVLSKRKWEASFIS